MVPAHSWHVLGVCLPHSDMASVITNGKIGQECQLKSFSSSPKGLTSKYHQHMNWDINFLIHELLEDTLTIIQMLNVQKRPVY